MKKFLSILFGITFCAAGLAQTASQPGPPDPLAEMLIAKSKAVPQAVHAKDVKALNELLAADFKIVGSEGRLHDRGELLGAAQEGALHDFMFYNPQLIKIGDDSAVVTYNLIVTMPEGDDLFAPRYQRISDLWVRQGDGTSKDWRLKFEQATPLRSID
jgi:hypothetical protein